MKTLNARRASILALLALGLGAPGPVPSHALPQDAQDPYTRVQEAQAALDAGDHDTVLTIVDGLLAEYPESPSSHLLRAMALDELGRYDEAEESYEAALRSAPDEPQILTQLGMHHLRREAWPSAIPPLERSLEARPDDSVALFYLAQAYFNSDRKGDGAQAIERAVALAPDNPTILVKAGEYRAHAGKHTPALEALARAQELNPDEPGLDLALGNVYLRLLEVEKAREALGRAETLDPENPAVLSSLAEACSKARDHAAAKGYYEKLLALGQDEALYYLGLGAALVGLGENEAAIPLLNIAVEKDPRLEEAHFHLARAYQATGRRAESQRELGIFRALKANPFSPLEDRKETEQKLWRQAGELVDEGQEEEALKLLTREGVEGNVPDFLVGALYYWKGQYEDAERLFSRATAAAPTTPNLRTYLGLTHLKQGRLDEAERALAEELGENPREPLLQMALGELSFARGDWAEAVTHLQRSKIVDTRVLLLLCEAQLRLDDQPGARETAQLITTLAAGDDAVLAATERLLGRYGLKMDEDGEPVAEAPQPAGAGGDAP